MRRSSLVGFLLTLTLLCACEGGDGDACVLDSDCADFSNVCIEGLCRPAGALPSEGGTRMDAATTPRDAGRLDAGSPAMDAGEPLDAAPADAMPTPEDATPTDGRACSTVPATWTVSSVGASAACGGATMGAAVTITEVTPCSFMASSLGTTAISGTFDLNSDDTLMGELAPGTAASTTCTGTFDPSVNTLAFTCSGCDINLGASASRS